MPRVVKCTQILATGNFAVTLAVPQPAESARPRYYKDERLLRRTDDRMSGYTPP